MKDKFDKICKKAIFRYAKQFGVSPNDVQIRMYLKADHAKGEWVDSYSIYKHFKPHLDVTFDEIHDVMIDFFRIKDTVTAIIQGLLVHYAGERGVDFDKVSGLVVLDENEVDLWLYEGVAAIKILGEEEVMEVAMKLMQQSGQEIE